MFAHRAFPLCFRAHTARALLLSSPQVWAEQEERKLSEVRAAAARLSAENERLRALQKRVPYKEVTQAAKIEYLRKELYRLHGTDADAQHLARSIEAVRAEKAEQQRLLERSLAALEGLSERLAVEKVSERVFFGGGRRRGRM